MTLQEKFFFLGKVFVLAGVLGALFLLGTPYGGPSSYSFSSKIRCQMTQKGTPKKAIPLWHMFSNLFGAA